jgi:hypothetical protein
VAWQVDDQVRYYESQGDAWSAIHVLELNDGLDLEQAHTILEQRARQR